MANPAYVIAWVDVHDAQRYETYKRLSTHAMQVHGAQVCIRGGAVGVLEGDWSPERVVMLKFPSVDAARAYYDTPEYREAREAREGIAKMRMIVVEGVS